MDLIESSKQLYKYVRNLTAARLKVVQNINKQDHVNYLKDILSEESEYINYRGQNLDEELGLFDDGVILSVRRPDDFYSQCPKPPKVLDDWLQAGWDNPRKEPAIVETKIVPSKPGSGTDVPDLEFFESSDNRVRAYNEWKLKRDEWAYQYRKHSNARTLFDNLFLMHQELERDSDTIELVVGEGLFIAKNPKIEHPIITKQLKTEYDARRNEIKIFDTDEESRIYTTLLTRVENISTTRFNEFINRINENDIHPLDTENIQPILKEFLRAMSPNSQVLKADEEILPNSQSRFFLRMNPVFFVQKKHDPSIEAIDEIIEDIEENQNVPKHILNIVSSTGENAEERPPLTLEQQLAEVGGEDVDILLAKEANSEQLEIARRINYQDAVLVQGPPGTGKTHTIANLIGNFLSEGKTVLVTSHTSKALRVLKEKIYEPLRDLSVSLLDNESEELQNAVDRITQITSENNSNSLLKKVESSEKARREVIDQLAETRKKIFNIKYSEIKNIVINGEEISPIDAAKYVNKYALDYSEIIPGKVKLNVGLPLSNQELIDLYSTNGQLSMQEELELDVNAVEMDSIMSPEDFAQNCAQIKDNENRIYEILNPLDLHWNSNQDEASINLASNDGSQVFSIKADDEAAVQELKNYIANMENPENWQINAIAAGQSNGGQKNIWLNLINKLIETKEYSDSIIEHLTFRVFTIKPELPISLRDLAIKLEKEKNKFKGIQRLFGSKNKTILEEYVLIDGQSISSLEDAEIFSQYLRLEMLREESALMWDRLIGFENPDKAYYKLNETYPESIAFNFVEDIIRYLNWSHYELPVIMDLITRAGFNLNEIFPENKLLSVDNRIKRDYTTISNIVNPLCDLILINFEVDEIKNNLNSYKKSLTSEGTKSSSSIELERAFDSYDVDLYKKSYDSILNVYNKKNIKKTRNELLDKLRDFAPEWASAIASRIGIHAKAQVPEDIDKAWTYKQYEGILDDLLDEPFAELQDQSVKLSKHYRELTGEQSKYSAWYHLVKKTERNPALRSSLNSWELAMKKIGKGTGKKAPRFKAEARRLMAQCQEAVPVWIMPMRQAIESFSPQDNKFDVVIVDEASQSDLTSLAVLYFAKKVIIVGDDKQVSPLGVGASDHQGNQIAESTIAKHIPNWKLFTGNTSLYDVAKLTFSPIMLKEHFRCVPEIIDYSNKESYDYKIKPLRAASDTNLSPAVIEYRTDGRRSETNKTNKVEAETITALIKACLENEEYQDKTFGVISLLGNEQARLISEMLLKEIGAKTMDDHNIICGDASQFQGDERDVIFLSMVDSNEGEGPLRKRGEGIESSTKKRYNVATSRARDQLWLVHSLDMSNDLKEGDIRRNLLEYVKNPSAYALASESVEALSDSPFEEEVAKKLLARNYKIEQQHKVGAYSIDMVILQDGRKIAIECDGERWHSGEEKVREDMERQTILERLGWEFIRIRGSEYYRNPEAAMERVFNQLSIMGITPEYQEVETEIVNYELKDKVIRRVQSILLENENNQASMSLSNPDVLAAYIDNRRY